MSMIISYDGTTNDDDALVLGRMLSAASIPLALAYVRHSREYDPGREEIAQHDAERRLTQGALWLEDPEVARHVVLNPSTGAGLAELAASERAQLIVFGSDYRTPPGRVEPARSAQQLLDGGAVAVAVAKAGLRTDGHGSIKTIAVAPSDGDDAPQQTAQALAAALGAAVAPGEDLGADLVVVGSGPMAGASRIALSSAARAKLETVRGSVLVLARETPLLP